MIIRKTYWLTAAVCCAFLIVSYAHSTHAQTGGCYLGKHDDVVCANVTDGPEGAGGGSGAAPASGGWSYQSNASGTNRVGSTPIYIPAYSLALMPVPQFAVPVFLPVVPTLPIIPTPQIPPITCGSSSSSPTSPSSPSSPSSSTTPPATGGCADFLAALRKSENGGNYGGPNNSIGCVGAYQFCGATKTAYFPGMSDAQIKADPAAQDAAVMKFMQDNLKTLKRNGACSSGKSAAALLGGAHLGGVGSTSRGTGVLGYLNRGIDHDDGHTKISQYMNKFGGYDLSSCGLSCS